MKRFWWVGLPILALAWFLFATGGEKSLPGVVDDVGVPPVEGGRGPAGEVPPLPVEGGPSGSGRIPASSPSKRVRVESPGDLRLLEGRVVLGSGEGLPGAEVFLFSAGGKDPSSALEKAYEFSKMIRTRIKRMEGRGGSAGADLIPSYGKILLRRLELGLEARVRSGRGGRYRFPGKSIPPAGKRFLVLAAVPPRPFLPGDPVQVKPSHFGKERGPDLKAVRPASLEGLVLGRPTATPVCWVAAWRLGKDRILDKEYRVLFRKSEFSFLSLRPGRWRLALFVPFQKTFFSWGPVVDLREGEGKSGVVLDGRTPSSLELRFYGPEKSPLLMGVRVYLVLTGAGPPGEPGEALSPEKTLFTGETGKDRAVVSLPRLSPGRFRVKAELLDVVAPAFMARREKKKVKNPYRLERDLFLRPGPNTVEMIFPELPPRLDLRVLVKDALDTPISKGTVRVWPRFSWGPQGTSRSASLGFGGIALFQGLPPGRFRILVSAPGFFPYRGKLDLTKEKSGFAEREYTLFKAGRIEGVLLDASGRPLVNSVVLVQTEGGKGGRLEEGVEWFIRTCRTGKGGRFSLEVPKGRYVLRRIGVRTGLSRQKVVSVDWGKTVKVELRVKS